jgi:hypothetical protein
MKKLVLVIFMASLACSSLSRKPASEIFPAAATGSLFAAYEPLNFELDAPLGELFRGKRDNILVYKAARIVGTLSYQNEENQKVTVPVEVKIKGFTSTNCPFPKLELKITGEVPAGSLLSGLGTMDLNTHCAEPDEPVVTEAFRASFYAHREALIYRMAEVLGVPTYRARPVFMKYSHTQIPRVDKTPFYRAFFLEDMSSLRKRLHAKEIKGTHDTMKDLDLAKYPEKAGQYAFEDVSSAKNIDREDVARIALFEALIGNGDWFVKISPDKLRGMGDLNNLWNIKILEMPTGRWVMFPQDFNFTGMVMGGPSQPVNADTFGAADRATQEKLQRHFLEKKPELYDLLKTLTQDPNGAGAMQKALDSFYGTI